MGKEKKEYRIVFGENKTIEDKEMELVSLIVIMSMSIGVVVLIHFLTTG